MTTALARATSSPRGFPANLAAGLALSHDATHELAAELVRLGVHLGLQGTAYGFVDEAQDDVSVPAGTGLVDVVGRDEQRTRGLECGCCSAMGEHPEQGHLGVTARALDLRDDGHLGRPDHHGTQPRAEIVEHDRLLAPPRGVLVEGHDDDLHRAPQP